LRGTPTEPPAKTGTAAAAESRPAGGLLASVQAQVAAKKNDEPRPVIQEVASPISPVPPIAAPTPVPLVDAPPVASAVNGAAEAPVLRADPAHVAEAPTPEASAPLQPLAERESVLEKFKLAMAGGIQPKPEAAAPRVSRREQLAQVAEQ